MKLDIKKQRYAIDQIVGHFGLVRGVECDILTHWLNVVVAPLYHLPNFLETKRQKLFLEGDVWNEEELKMHFLSFVIDYADLEIPQKAKVFYERALSGVVQDTPLSVVCDAMIARPFGINTPQTPYFFLQEFKKSKNTNDDAEGQMLVAMLIAQQQNANKHPIYGCYVQGKQWTFTTLHDTSYCFSRTYDATQTHDLINIIHILKALKNLILHTD